MKRLFLIISLPLLLVHNVNSQNGEVILGQGNITLSAEYVEIKNSTAVPLGTTLTIGN